MGQERRDARPHRFGWTYTAPHNTDYWKYYITKKGWNPNEPLDRGDFEVLATFEYDGRAADTYPVHTIDIPSDRTGYYVILAQWEIDDTGAAFYNVVDVDIQPGTSTPDTTAPSAPTGLTSAATTASSVDLRWTASTDDRGVASYRVERATGSGAFAQVATPAGTSYLNTGLAASTTYRYRVSAVDAAGNVSAASAVFSVTTASGTTPDTTQPSAPTGLASSGVTSSSVNLSWTASTDDRGVTGYRVERATATGAFQQVAQVTTTSYQNTGLAAATTYRYRVSAVDAAGNVSGLSTTISVTTSSGTTPTYPTWNSRGAYTKGDRVTWNGKVYEAVQTYQGVGDTNWINAGSLWKVVG
ncbi:lytic polysaccharide monooxygenase [Agromyces protaetiae]|uniref:lytic polysaccharide monooxygenase n=1 Tax=Agromyces protaetiae TaxID=2509455 RepID=UPI0013EABD32|nr:lytic polysaccharide monooxygenase [Agromyces protaetiae]